MSVTQIIKGLAGKEDINWGDADSTFSRETPTGGTVSISYVDDSVIPASGINSGNSKVSDFLHEQNTDTGTTSSTFDIDSDGNRARLSSSGLTADRTFTFPDASEKLVGETTLASTANGDGASLVGIEDAGGYTDSTDVEAALQELYSDISGINTAYFRGFISGLRLVYNDSSNVTIGGGCATIRLDDGTNYVLVVQANQTLNVNPSSANTLYYIYIDGSSITASGVITDTNFTSSTTAPSTSTAKNGWYNGDDRCIGAVLTDGSNNIREFRVGRHLYYQYRVPFNEFATANCPTSYTQLDVSSSVPIFAKRARIRIDRLNASSANQYWFDISNSGVTYEGIDTSVSGVYSFDVPTTDSRVIWWYGETADDTTVDVLGYYLDGIRHGN